jgi:protoporphyrin/coproporphyrin ferrochelatase
MRIGVIVLNFGEPEQTTHEEVRAFLERIFLRNGGLERLSGDAARDRARELADQRTPGLVEDYNVIGGSPLNRQAREQAAAIEAELGSRGLDAICRTAFQFTSPSIADTVSALRADGVDVLVALPVYPLCGQSTTVAALDDVESALRELDWDVPHVALSGWHDRAEYVQIRADVIARHVREHGLDLADPDTILYFSAHGTPLRYLEAGNRYDRYVEQHTKAVAARLGVERHAVGFQNHTNRRIAWTQPDNEDRIRELSERRLVVDAISFVHEQSETLFELDRTLRGFVEDLGKEFHRVPVPHGSEELTRLLASLVEGALAAHAGKSHDLARCRCRPAARTWCTNGDRDLPPSPWGGQTASPENATRLPA